MTIATRTVQYRHQETALTGLLAWDEAVKVPRPGILLVHGGAGLDDHAKAQARRYASLGYAVLACDMLGDGIAGDRQRIVARLTELRGDPDLMIGCARAGLVALSACSEVDGVLAAVGFCFGGLTVLTMARGGAFAKTSVAEAGPPRRPKASTPRWIGKPTMASITAWAAL